MIHLDVDIYHFIIWAVILIWGLVIFDSARQAWISVTRMMALVVIEMVDAWLDMWSV